MQYEFSRIEKKWQKYWSDHNTFAVTEDPAFPREKRAMCLVMFPYPSGSGLHVGHLKNYVPLDAYARYKWMNGNNVLHPMGWDAFGQPAENEAIKRGRNPRDMVPEYAANYRSTLQLVGCSYDWNREINSSLPEYYKWTQWIFLQLHKRGLAYRNHAPINWCPSCQTGLANEEVKEGRCWRCDSGVEKKPMPQWFFKITAYADRLLADLDKINWSEGVKEMQRDWIGKSEGAEVDFTLEGGTEKIRVFTTRPDTLFGATFMVLAPEHPLVAKITTPDKKSEVESYVTKAQRETEIDRLNAERAKTGVFTGAYAINPVNGARVPIWIADYVLMGYGTGAIMAVPGHDARDFAFAKAYNIPIIQVVSKDGSSYPLSEAEPCDGIAVNSGAFSGLKTADFKKKITAWLEEKELGKAQVNFKLRDWLISRQRYWGAPIPIIHCPKCGDVAVPEQDLPVVLPPVENYQPTGTGESPLAAIPEFVNTSCPTCGGKAKRETDTMGGFACSSWYFLRFADPQNAAAMASREAMDYWLPVGLYAGGVEHVRGHLLYARFWTKVLFDAGLIGFDEPFSTLKNQGSLLAYTPGRKPRRGESGGGESDGTESIVDWIVLKSDEREKFPKDEIVWRWARMSKSKGNVVTPDEIAEKYGADSLRLCVLFVAPFEDDVQWNEEAIHGAHRYVARVWRWISAAMPAFDKNWKDHLPTEPTAEEKKVRRKLHQTIAKVGSDLEAFQFNTAIAALMELTNEIYAYAPLAGEGELAPGKNGAILSELMQTLTQLIAPLTPHMCEEIWESLKLPTPVVKAPWPKADAAVAAADTITVVFQVNGKLRGQEDVAVGTADDALIKLALASAKVQPFIEGKTVVKTIVVQGKLVNIVVK
jgi:leucyl-tRNA synthetase